MGERRPQKLGSKDWASLLMFVVIGFAALATSEPGPWRIHFEGERQGRVELTAAQPKWRVEIELQARDSSPEELDATSQSGFTLRGSVLQPLDQPDGAPATIREPGTTAVILSVTGSPTRRVYQTLEGGGRLEFIGDCGITGKNTLSPDGPCRTTLQMDFERDDGGDIGGVVSVEWAVELRAEATKQSEPDETAPLPWHIEVRQFAIADDTAAGSAGNDGGVP